MLIAIIESKCNLKACVRSPRIVELSLKKEYEESKHKQDWLSHYRMNLSLFPSLFTLIVLFVTLFK